MSWCDAILLNINKLKDGRIKSEQDACATRVFTSALRQLCWPELAASWLEPEAITAAAAA